MAGTNYVTNEELVSGAVGPQDGAVEVQQTTTTPPQNQRPWEDVRTLLDSIARRAQRIGLYFSRMTPRRPGRRRWKLGNRENPPNTTESSFPSRTTDVSNTRHRQDIVRSTDAPNAAGQGVGRQVGVGDASIQVQTQIGGGYVEDTRSGPRAAPMVEESSQRGIDAASGDSSPKLMQLSKAIPRKYTADLDAGTGTTGGLFMRIASHQYSVESGESSSRRYLDTEHHRGGYVPPSIRDDVEFASSAVMMRDSSGNLRAEKLFYDSMTPTNWASDAFVNCCGLQPRPIRPEDLKVYTTLNGSFTPTHYVDMELKDESQGMKDFAKLSLNITSSMDGIGLLAGRAFMREHNIVVDAKAGRGSYVTTSRKAGPEAQEAQRLLLEETKKEYELAKQLSASTAGPSTQQSGVSADEKLPTSSTVTGTSALSDIKWHASK